MPQKPHSSSRAREPVVWPPPDEVLQTMVVVDLQTGEARPLKLELPVNQPSTADEPPPADEPSQPDEPPAVGHDRSQWLPSAVTAREWFQHPPRWLPVAIATLAIAEAIFISLNLLGSPTRRSEEPISSPTPSQASAPADVVAAAPIASHAGQPVPAEETRPTTGQSGRVIVRSVPDGARVWIDGKPRGQTPLTAAGLEPGTHAVVIESATGRIQQAVDVTPGGTATLVASVPAASATGGIMVTAPAELQIYEGGRLLGTSRAERVLLEKGRHALDLLNEPLGYRARREVDVAPGKMTRIAVQFPNGTLNLNALPWAEVLLDGRSIGDTPLGNISVPVGTHEVIFRHPELGQIERTVEVTLRAPARLSVDFQRERKDK